MLVLRDLARGRHRFSDLQASLEGMSANLLSERLKKLEEQRMVELVSYRAHPPRFEYRLTAKGRAFVPVLSALRAYGERWEPAASETAPD
jgi:DNA-binding HxlR family transcriptional regulator